MKKFAAISVLLLLSVVFGFVSCNQMPTAPEKTIANSLISQIDSFAAVCSKLRSAVENNSSSSEQLQSIFIQARLSFKKFEWAAEYFDPATSKLVNGPPVQEVEPDGRIIEPSGLQVIEGLLFPTYDQTRKKELLRQLNLLESACGKYKARFSNIDIFDWQVFDAARLEVYRVITLGITGFDNPLTQNSMQESAAALQSLKKVLGYYKDNENNEDLMGKFDLAEQYLSGNTNFNSFNRMEFIISYCNPITTAISGLEERLKIHVYRYNRLVNQDAKTLFDTNAFNVNAYAPDHSSFISDKKIVLGRTLFSDPILSGTGKRSCQSCHQPDKAFADGLAKNTVIGGKELLDRNTPTLINAALQPALFYDLRVNTLEDQSHTVIHSNKEMHGSMELSVKKLWQDKKYRKMFLEAFPNEDTTRIDTFEVMNALGSFIRNLTFLNSRFDEYMRGNKTAMDSREINGFNLFMGKAKCATCHYMPLFNGAFPPRFLRIEAEVIGVPRTKNENIIDPDLGRYEIIKVESFRHAFKTPTVRNAALTGPYMHNGVFTTLEEVMDFYNKGGGRGLGIKLDNQTLPFDSLNLSGTEQQEIIAFIKSLNSKLPEK